MKMIKRVHASEIPLGIDRRILYKTPENDYSIDISFHALKGWLFIKSRQTGKIYKVALSDLVKGAIEQGIDKDGDDE